MIKRERKKKIVVIKRNALFSVYTTDAGRRGDVHHERCNIFNY